MNPQSSAIFLATFAALLWGLWWMPIRYLASLGIPDLWGGLLLSAALVPPLGIFLLFRRDSRPISRQSLLGAAIVGLAVTSFSTAINLSDVVRVILLFYLAPAWSKLIETWFMGQPWKRSSSLTLALTLVGAFLVLGGELTFANINGGDLLALISGLCWSVGAALIFSKGPSDVFKLTFTTATAAVLAGLIGAVFFSTIPDPDALRAAIVPVSLGAVIYVLPILMITMWSAQVLSPALLSFLLTAEILSGVLSGVLFLEEPFGVLQALGGICIVLAAGMEIISAKSKRRVPATAFVGNSK